MKVIVREDRRAPTVVHMVLYRAGSIDEVNGRTGVAHVLEHMMFKGTRTAPQGEFSRRVAAARRARERVHLARLHRLLPAAGQPRPGRGDGAGGRSHVEPGDRRRGVRQGDQGGDGRAATAHRGSRAIAGLRAVDGHGLDGVAVPRAGDRLDERPGVDDASTTPRAWYRDWYVPSNAVLVVVGDVSGEAVYRLAERTYGRIAARALPQRKPQIEPAQRGLRRAWVKAPAENPYVMLGFKVPRSGRRGARRRPVRARIAVGGARRRRERAPDAQHRARLAGGQPGGREL